MGASLFLLNLDRKEYYCFRASSLCDEEMNSFLNIYPNLFYKIGWKEEDQIQARNISCGPTEHEEYNGYEDITGEINSIMKRLSNE